MHLMQPAILLAAGLSGAFARPEGHLRREGILNGVLDWLQKPLDGKFLPGPGNPSVLKGPKGEGIGYKGNVGSPWGSNFMEPPAQDVHKYQYVVRFDGSETTGLHLRLWNTMDPEDKMAGFFNKWGSQCHNTYVAAGTSVYIAFAADSQGGWTTSESEEFNSNSIGIYSSTWGEFDFGSQGNEGWSGFDVSVIQSENPEATNPNPYIRGMEICDATNQDKCSFITEHKTAMQHAWDWKTRDQKTLAVTLHPDPTEPVRVVVKLDYKG